MSNLSDFLGGVVKSVQRGALNYSGSSPSPYIISISQVNVDKAVLFFSHYGSDSYQYKTILSSSTEITIYNTHNPIGMTWQVIEFY
jgi:hypothetical protein